MSGLVAAGTRCYSPSPVTAAAIVYSTGLAVKCSLQSRAHRERQFRTRCSPRSEVCRMFGRLAAVTVGHLQSSKFTAVFLENLAHILLLRTGVRVREASGYCCP